MAGTSQRRNQEQIIGNATITTWFEENSPGPRSGSFTSTRLLGRMRAENQ